MSDSSESAPRACAAFELALRSRAPGMHATTPMVRRLAVKLSRHLDLDPVLEAQIDLCAQVRDVGMIALPDTVVLATGALSPTQWEALNRHCAIGSEMLVELPETAPLAPVVRAHHERWDGEGYPDGIAGEAIPLLSRVIAVCDAFVAIASDRPYRRGLGAEAALEHVSAQRGSQFDPRLVDELRSVLTGQTRTSGRAPGTQVQASAVIRDRAAPRVAGHRRDLRGAIERFEVLAAFGPARDRVLSETAGVSRHGDGDLVAAVESDIGLTVAVLRRAHVADSSITSVSDAVAALTVHEVREAVTALPVASFPWRTPLEQLMHRVRVHAQAVARAAERIAGLVTPEVRDELITVALLHDAGKLVLAQADRGYVDMTERSMTPEERVRHERRVLGVDHASLGGLLVDRWRLPPVLSRAVSAHHGADDVEELATVLRLADMATHLAHGAPVNRGAMLQLANTCGLSAGALREVLFDLPHAGGSQRRRAQRSPLSDRETAVVRLLAQGLVYKQIGDTLGLSTSTIRTHLHNIYHKLEVADRAQAVLRATEMAWI